ncbi:MAG: type IV pilus modification PilV family protein [Actinomycetota bacterium]
MRRLHGRFLGACDDGGFGLVEVMVSLGVVLVSLTSLAYVATSGFRSIAVARERQAAVALLDRTMEQIRALPYDTVKLGLRTADLAGDPAVSGSGTVGSPYRLAATNERIPHGVNGTVTPLVPNAVTTTVGGKAYTTVAYVSHFNDDTASGAFRITVVATWTTRLGNLGARRIQNQSILYSPAGCLSTATHPFSAPCQPFSYASAATESGGVDVTASSFFGQDLAHASLDLGSTSSSMQLEQLSSVQGRAAGSGVSLSVAGIEQSLNHAEAITRSDNDPSSPGSNPYDTATATTLPAGSLSQSAGGNLLTLHVGANDEASSTSTVAASATNACPNHAGTAQTDGLPCGRSTSRQNATMSSTLDLDGLGLGLGTITLAEVQAAPTTSLSHTNRDLTQSSYCTGTGGNGCVHARASRSIGTVRLGGLPLGLLGAPLGWEGYLVELTGYSDTVTAEAGINAAAPTVTTAGTIRYWNGSGYTTRSLAVPGIGEVLPVTSVSAGIGLLSSIELTASLSTGGTTTSSTAATCGGSACRTAAEATSRSPLVGSIGLRVVVLGADVLNLTINVDLGSSVAEAEYSEPPAS